ncbi:MAG: PEGA domain-containing protein, partial [Bacteroidales bacterium]|nr:PEGA domain-containing protein [Bacteroidales bacterium]
LTTGSVKTVTNISVNQQFVMFQVTPANASVELNDEALLVDEQGMASKRLPYGRYNYRVSCTDYHTQAGVVEVKADGKAVVNVSLKPKFGWIDIAADTEFHGAYVYLDNERIGQVPMKTQALKSNSYHLRFMKPMYKNYEQDVLVRDNETTHIQLQMHPNFAQVTLQAADETEIWVEGEHKGNGVLTLKLEPGQYKVETKRASHQSNSRLIQINSSAAQTFRLEDPAPLYGSLEVNSSPMMAQVYLDGIKVGETPLFLNNVLIGTHELRLEKEGYALQTNTIMVEHGQVAIQTLTLSSRLTLRFDANGGSGQMNEQIFDAGSTKSINANAFARSGYAFAGWNTAADGSGISYTDKQSISLTQDVTLYAQWKKGNFENGHEWVDLGLPSGIKWATCNVGAATPQGYGDYFAWGETSPKSNYTWETYKFRTSGNRYDNVRFSKYNTKRSHGKVDNKITLEISDDAARSNWGGSWRMPTEAEQDELRNNCIWTWTTQSGVNGYKVTSNTNGNSIFLPSVGRRSGTSVGDVESGGYYWSSSLYENYPNNAYDWDFLSGNVDWYVTSNRYYGHTVRAVCP